MDGESAGCCVAKFIVAFILLIIHLFMIFKGETFKFEVLLNQAIYTFLL